MLRVIRSQGAGFYQSQHTPCEFFYTLPPLLKHPLRFNKLGKEILFLNKPATVQVFNYGVGFQFYSLL